MTVAAWRRAPGATFALASERVLPNEAESSAVLPVASIFVRRSSVLSVVASSWRWPPAVRDAPAAISTFASGSVLA